MLINDHIDDTKCQFDYLCQVKKCNRYGAFEYKSFDKFLWVFLVFFLNLLKRQSQ